MPTDIDNPFLRAILEGTRPRTAPVRISGDRNGFFRVVDNRPRRWAAISADGHWIRCQHRRCQQAIGAISAWKEYDPELTGGAYEPMSACRIPGLISVLQRGWEYSVADGWIATPKCAGFIRQERGKGNQDVIGLPGGPAVMIEGVHLSRQARRNSQRAIVNKAGLGHEVPVRLVCAWCGGLVAVDTERMVYAARPLTWTPGTPHVSSTGQP